MRMGCCPGICRTADIARLKFDLLRDAEGIINLDPEITHGALQLRVAKQQLHCSQIAGLLANLYRLRSAQRVRAICRATEPGALRPSMDNAGDCFADTAQPGLGVPAIGNFELPTGRRLPQN
jgi:hypothetical protein